MSSRRRVVVSTTGLLLIVGACSSAPGNGPIQLASTPSAAPTPAISRTLSGAQIDSIYAQALAEREGPRVSVSAEFANVAYTGSRRVRANVHLDDDAYVMVGQISPDGILRVVFPQDPSDDGFLRGNHSYQTAEFFAGFEDQYRFRAASSPWGRFGQGSRNSYDAGFGYLFVIASWRPLRFDRFSTGGEWDSFELVDSEYLRDPTPAVYEFAALLAGPNREAYTVKFANYSTTQYAYDGGLSDRSAYGYGFCNGYAPLGFAGTPFNSFSLYNASLAYGQSFYYRGQYYAYNAFGDCYTITSPWSRYGGGYGGYIVAQAPPVYRTRPFDLGARNPITPQPPKARLAADAAKATDHSAGAMVSPVYRSRGLLTSDTPDPRRGTGSEPAPRTRPTIQEMVGRHFEGTDRTTRAQIAGDQANPRGTRNQSQFDTPTRGRETTNSDSRGSFSRPKSDDSPRPAPQSPRAETPRSESPRVSAPPPRSEAPRSESPRVERSSPPPAPAPRSETPPPKPPEVKNPGR
ncbi:MAG TPA: hypothetical protein VI259_12475 [Gemmatimonadaceae bacterium]